MLRSYSKKSMVSLALLFLAATAAAEDVGGSMRLLAEVTASDPEPLGLCEPPALESGRKVVVVTGASSGLGLAATSSLIKSGAFVVAAARDVEKMRKAAHNKGIADADYLAMELDLSNMYSVSTIVDRLHQMGNAWTNRPPLDHLVCNAAVYLPTDPDPKWSEVRERMR